MLKIKIFVITFLIFSSALFGQGEQNNLTNKGGFYSGLSFNFKVKSSENQNLILYQINELRNDDININLDQGYFIKDDFAVGVLLNFAYADKKGVQTNSSNILEDFHTKSIGWSIYATMKNYLALDEGKRFNVFNLIKFGGTFENTLSEKFSEDILSRSYKVSKSIELLFYPGLMARVAAGFAIEAGIEIAGFRAEWSQTKLDGKTGPKESSFSGDFTINILKIGIGFYYYY